MIIKKSLKRNRNYYLIILFLILSNKLGFSENCTVSHKIFDFSENQCTKFNDILRTATKNIVQKINIAINDSDNNCIPEKLKEL